MPIRSLTSRSAAVVAAASAALALAGCGGGSSGSASGDSAGAGGSASAGSALPSVSVDQSLAAMVPDKVKSDGVITVGSDTTYAPNEFLAADGRTIQGFDVDLFQLVAQKLGLKANFQTAPFDSIIAGVSSGKYEAGVSSFTINPEREQQADMVSYFNVGTQWAAKKGAKIDPDSPCGLKVAVQQATVQVPDIQSRSQVCQSQGKPAVTIDQYEAQSDATAAVVSGKDDAMLADYPVAVYAVKQTNGQLQLVGKPYDAAPYGYVVPKGEDQFAQALAGAVKALIQSGEYKQVLDKWGVEGGAITDPTVNPTVGK